MITVTLNRTEFEYDIHSLIKAFFPKEDVELYYTKEAHADEKNVACTNHSAEQEEAGSSHFSIDYADDRISIAWDDAPDGPFVVDLIVAPDYRRRGIATALVSEVAARCSQWGFDTLALRLDRRHGGARELYSVLGFEEIA